MLKSVLYYLLILTTSVRFVDLLYLLVKDTTNLPAAVLVVSSAMVVYGMVLAAKRFFGAVRVKQLLTFYLIQSVMIVFNLAYVSMVSPLQVTAAETLAVGTFLDLLVNCGILYAGFRQVRGATATVQRVR